MGLKKIPGVGIGMRSACTNTLIDTYTTERKREKKYQGPFFTETSSHLLPWQPCPLLPRKITKKR